MIKKTSGRRLALDALLAIAEEGAYANRILNSLFTKEQPDEKEKRLATELVLGTLRHRSRLDFLLNRLLTKELSGLPVAIREVLRLSLYQLIFTNHPAYAVVNEAVALTKAGKYRGLSRLVNGVLRNYLRRQQELEQALPDFAQDPVGHLTIVHSHPRWLVERWIRRWGEEMTHRLVEANNAPAPLSVRTNTLRINRDELLAAMTKAGIEAEPVPTIPEAIRVKSGQELTSNPLWTEGYFYIQDEASMLVAHLLAPEPGMVIADLCAAPGGKTTHLAQLMNNLGRIYALDQFEHKTALIAENARRLGIGIIEPLTTDARCWRPAEPVDGILLDAPCTGTGVIRRRPDIRWRRQPDDLAQLVPLQQELLNHAASLLRPGGRLVYSTCSLEREENEEQITRFLAAHPEFRVDLPANFAVDFPADRLAEGFLIMPRVDGPDGFFMTRLVKS
ncbi:MAG TPA: 16S rRNA (cytosine(967)-C(5))-methyltransferase RsmB [Firmicutes bacterium]|uniref:16S rRNA (cytosine(967)-C(5))-methyltransferase n=1 Tax=Capillibacterium thermochitinicola TaxID=2699427 RepID=A0A8J6LSW1_9FIRM|nr:16S rRNA (cytosine(967)-C(5))-methyltransferase RsmB [Capillibacterium thermochitinicola]MBA2133562.1 16S rRNA (cytosine(967)-C(5))-methyltransferase RsmB [Capillibacterium thermochitinicola]HHW12350.1 16S rRNA (cytosine(967)-C(5))-methyltransferase RsmB [Bacillota bacterium]